MKHFISFSFALCSIVLAALHFTPTFPDGNLKPPQEEKFKTYNPAKTVNVELFKSVFSPGNLPEKISVPKPEFVLFCYPSNEVNMDLENLRLNGLLYKDLEPDNSI